MVSTLEQMQIPNGTLPDLEPIKIELNCMIHVHVSGIKPNSGIKKGIQCFGRIHAEESNASGGIFVLLVFFTCIGTVLSGILCTEFVLLRKGYSG